MKSKKVKEMFPLNLQYFAESSDNNGGSDDGENNNNNDNGNGENENQSSNNSGEKTFTQSQVNDMMAKEKNEGRRAMLKSLGFKNEEDAKKAIEGFNAFMKLQKSEQEINKDDVEKAKSDVAESELRAQNAENKLSCYEAGVNKDCIDDVLAIARTKVTENKSLDDVLKEMKKDNKYSTFFSSSNQGNKGGTGSQPGHSGGSGDSKPGSYGKSLAERASGSSKTETKSNFF